MFEPSHDSRHKFRHTIWIIKKLKLDNINILLIAIERTFDRSVKQPRGWSLVNRVYKVTKFFLNQSP